VKNNRSQIILLLILATILLLVGIYTYNLSGPDSETDESAPASVSLVSAEGSAYTDLAGNELDFASNIGNVIVVYAWASWSPTSVEDLNALNSLVDEFSGDEVNFIAMNRAEPEKTAKAFLKSYEVSSQIEIVLDPDDKYYNSIGAFSMPETVIFRKDGSIAYQKSGSINVPLVRRYIADNLD